MPRVVFWADLAARLRNLFSRSDDFDSAPESPFECACEMQNVAATCKEPSGMRSVDKVTAVRNPTFCVQFLLAFTGSSSQRAADTKSLQMSTHASMLRPTKSYSDARVNISSKAQKCQLSTSQNT